jgi:transposase
LPATVRRLVGDQVTALDQLEARMVAYAEQIAAQAEQSEVAQRLQTIAGVGPTTAAAMVASVSERRNSATVASLPPGSACPPDSTARRQDASGTHRR